LDTEAIHSAKLRQLYTYWRSKAANGRLPSRADIDPIEIPQILPYVFLVDVEHGPLRFRFRLVGTQICTWSGRDVTGMYVDDPAYGPRGPEVIRQYAEVVARGMAFYIEQPAPRPERDYIFYDRIVLPLARDGRTVDMLLCAADLLPSRLELRAGLYFQMWDERLPQ
jgi:PAS domain